MPDFGRPLRQLLIYAVNAIRVEAARSFSLRLTKGSNGDIDRYSTLLSQSRKVS